MVPNYAFYAHRGGSPEQAQATGTTTTSTTATRLPERLRSACKQQQPELPASTTTSCSSPLWQPLSEKFYLPPPGVPSVNTMATKLEESTPLLTRPSPQAVATFASASAPVSAAAENFGRDAASRARLPQAIAHRGYKAAFPENSMAAFRSAVEIGAHAIETDLHLSKDGVVVLSHDATLKRCFGEEKKVADCDWSYLSTLRTIREPRQPMPRLFDLLEYLAQPGQEHMWVLLDIKKDDDASDLLSRIAAAFASVPSRRPWSERIIMGCWNVNYVRLCRKYLPDFSMAYIGWSLTFASALFAVPNMHFNLLQHSLTGPWGYQFLRRAHRNGRLVFDWTVNEEEWMEWSIRRGIDGVITDDPKLFLEICDRWSKEPERTLVTGTTFRKSAKNMFQIILVFFVAAICNVLSTLLKGSPRSQVRRALRS